MEKRNISVTLEQAIEWYNSNNTTLKTLALSAYSRNELEYHIKIAECNIEYIEEQLKCKTMIGHFNIIKDDYAKFRTLATLNTIAKYYNGDWKKTIYNIGYFITSSISDPSKAIVWRGSSKFPGIIYFKREEDAIKAINILGERVRDLFN